jgi:CubicO group peptidase (beta-lactamase class C family)
LFALRNGRLADGTQVLPVDWMKVSTSPSKGYKGYGYFWWLTDADIFKGVGIFGQGIYVNRKENVVIALHSARAVASDDTDWDLQNALYEALTNAIKD